MEYIPVFLLLLIGLAIGVGATALSYLLGPKDPHPRKDIAFECGVPALGGMHQRVSVRFYLVAILFLLFDVEVLFFYPWAVVYKKFLTVNSFILFEMGAFIAILLLGYFYVLRKGALEWE